MTDMSVVQTLEVLKKTSIKNISICFKFLFNQSIGFQINDKKFD